MVYRFGPVLSQLPAAVRRAPARVFLLLLLTALALPAVPLHAAAAATAATDGFAVIRAAVSGTRVTAPDLVSEAERVALDPDLAPLLLRTREESTVHVADWPVAPGVRADVTLTRHDVYAPGATVYRVEGGKKTVVPHSKLVFLWGTGDGDDRVGVSVSVDPDTGELRGLAQSQHGLHELRRNATGAGGAESDYLVAKPEAFFNPGMSSSDLPTWTCGEEDLPENALRSAASFAGTGSPLTASTGLQAATIAFDTDNEMMARYSDNTTSVTNYIASLVADMNVMYERDLSIHLLQGTTFLRISTVPDPYNQNASGNADGNKLQEFSSYWSANEGSVTRTVAAMLSGKQPGSGSASGIAWVSGLCSSSAGYSFSQVSTSVAVDQMIVGHEIGHNFGSPHTHCYNPPIDQCFSGEIFAGQACYSGQTSCPAPSTINGVPNVTGTLMSYCHLIGCSTPTGMMVFHPRTVTLVSTDIANALGVCIVPFGSSVTAVSPSTGATAGGTHVTISGTNFQAGATVTVGGVAATGVTVVNSTTITATTGAHATGAVDVVVTNPSSTAATLTRSFFYAAPPATTAFYTVAPCRLLDTRNANGPLGGPVLGAGALRLFTAAGACGVPTTAKSISANLTVITPTSTGFLAVYPGNAFPLGTSSVSFKTSTNRSNNAVIELATDGSGTFGIASSSGGTAHLVVDVNGYFQ